MPHPSLPSLPALAAKIASLPCDQLARATGFLRRDSGKLSPAGFLKTACLFALQSSASLSSFAQLWALLHGQTLSKQAVHKRCGAAAINFLQAILQAVVASLVRGTSRPELARGLFQRILIQDSTSLGLPSKLAALFPGPANQQSKKQAGLKIQATLDLVRNHWVRFHLSPFTCNDQAASPQILEGLNRGDLVIRDLGYLVLDVLRQIHQCGAYFLSRWRFGLLVSLPGSATPSNLLLLLGSSPVWDGTVLLGGERLPVRLVAVRLPQAVAAERRRKARADRDQRLRHSDQYFKLLDWNIFITNVPKELLAADALVNLYQLRWRIEIIFKSWKSHFHLEQLSCASAEQALIAVLGKLIWICWFTVQFNEILERGLQVSVLKLAAWWSKFALVNFQSFPLTPAILKKLADYYCRYDRRRTRLNFLEKCAALG